MQESFPMSDRLMFSITGSLWLLPSTSCEMVICRSCRLHFGLKMIVESIFFASIIFCLTPWFSGQTVKWSFPV